MNVEPRAGSGLYDARFEHDACGVAFVVDMHGRPAHAIVEQGLSALCDLEHRGASGSEVNTGDGAGILMQVPDRFLRAVAGFELPPAGAYAVGLAFLPAADPGGAATAVERIVAEEGFRLLGWRDVPVDDSMVGATAQACEPVFRQLFVACPGPDGSLLGGIDLDRRAFVLRKRIEHSVADVYFPSLSARTLIYKGMLTAPQL